MRVDYKKKILAKSQLTSYPQTEWLEYVQSIYVYVDKKKEAFSLKLTSGLVSGMSKTFTYNSWWEFEQFIKNLLNADYVGGSERYEFINSEQKMQDAYEYAMIEVVPLEGATMLAVVLLRKLGKKLQINGGSS